jgi:hypothetical protein
MLIKRRHVFHIAGYDPIGAGWYRTFKRELAKFGHTWSVRSTVSVPMPATGKPVWTVTTDGPNWFVETTYELLPWDDIVCADLGRSMPERLAKSMLALFEIARLGVLFRYFKANWQYGFFFLYPYLLLCLFGLAAAGLAVVAAHATEWPIWAQAPLLIVLGPIIFIGLLYWPGKRWRVLQGLDDWIFSTEYVHSRCPDLDARLDRFADRIIASTHDSTLDEVIVVGHSIGATLALEVIARALGRDHDFVRRGPAVCLLTVGSTIAKFTLHPAGSRFRCYAARIINERALAWAEYHARSDAISFYKFDPVRLLRFHGDNISGKPVFRRVYLQSMLEPRTYWNIRLRFMRLHYQFLMANERRTTYDYFMMVCGPLPFSRTVLAVRGPAELIAMDGSVIDPCAPVPTMPLAVEDLTAATEWQ